MRHYVFWFFESAFFALAVLLPLTLLALAIRLLRVRKGCSVKPLRAHILLLDFLLAGDLLVTLFLTLIARGWGERRINLTLFLGWIEAWNGWDAHLFALQFLNIAVFLPLGLLLAARFPALRRLWRVSAVGFVFSLTIELLQLLTGRGVFDLDDLFCNTLGALLGGALFCLIAALRQRKWSSALCCALPWLLSGAATVAMLLVYLAKPYGNLPADYIYRRPMGRVQISVSADLSGFPDTAPVYTQPSRTQADAEALAAACLSALGLDGEGMTAHYTANKGHFSHTAGLTLTYTLSDGSFFLSGRTDCPAPAFTDAAGFRSWLASIGFELPEATTVSAAGGEAGDATTQISLTVPSAQGWADTAQYTHFEDGAWHIYSTLTTLSTAAVEPIESAEEAIARIRDGRFRWLGDDFTTLEVTGLTLVYRIDTKGFYVPVWRVSVRMDGTPATLILRALAANSAIGGNHGKSSQRNQTAIQ